MTEISFSRFVYPDTNILGIVAEDLTKWRPFQDFLHKNDLCIALSAGQVAELADLPRLHQNLGTLLSAVPTIITKSPEQILEEEVMRYPDVRKATIIGGYANEFFLTDKIEEFLGSKSLAAARRDQRATSLRMAERLESLKSNFPPQKDGRYREAQADEFVWIYVLQWLAQLHPDFVQRFRDNASDLDFRPFLSVAMLGYVIFYKYYIHGKRPELSDFGDLFHTFIIPYCELAVMERDLCNVLNHIARNHSILENTVVKNISFLSEWKL